MSAPVIYAPKFVVDPDRAFAALHDELTWERRGDAPRCEYYCNDVPRPYVYGRGRGERLYEPRPYHPVILEIRRALEEFCAATSTTDPRFKPGAKFEVCFLNRYLNQSDHLGWHADDSPEMDDERPIASVSLGVEREIWFRTKPLPSASLKSSEEIRAELAAIEKLRLAHGSLCLMAPGMQDTHQHRIPKSPAQCGERISLTFRGYVANG